MLLLTRECEAWWAPRLAAWKASAAEKRVEIMLDDRAQGMLARLASTEARWKLGEEKVVDFVVSASFFPIVLPPPPELGSLSGLLGDW